MSIYPGKVGPFPGFISTVMPSAWGMTSISENIMAASKSILRNGCIVTSQASSGVRQIVKKSCLERTSRNSGRYLLKKHKLRITFKDRFMMSIQLCDMQVWNHLPACLIAHTGILSTFSHLAALNNKSFFRGGNDVMLHYTSKKSVPIASS